MELSQKYVYEIWKNQSFSKAAKKLYISQPSLSATVAKLEGELGFQIFDRSIHPITTTAKGRIYLSFLQEIYEAEIQLKNHLAATNDMDEGSLTIGGNIAFAQFVFPAVCRMFSEKFPKVSLTLDIDASEEKLRNQLVDLMFTFYPNEKEYNVIPVQNERLFVVIHKSHPAAKPLCDYALTFDEVSKGIILPEKEIVDPLLLSNVPFIKSSKKSDSDNRISAVLKDHLTAHYTVINSRTFDARYRMVECELGAIFVSDYFLKHIRQIQDDLYYFALRSPHSYRTTFMQYREDSDNRKLLGEFISMVTEYCKSDRVVY